MKLTIIHIFCNNHAMMRFEIRRDGKFINSFKDESTAQINFDRIKSEYLTPKVIREETF